MSPDAAVPVAFEPTSSGPTVFRTQSVDLEPIPFRNRLLRLMSCARA